MGSLFATGRLAMRLLDRLGVADEWRRLAWTLSAAIVGLIVWGVMLKAGNATYS